jgi:hypothetical protein
MSFGFATAFMRRLFNFRFEAVDELFGTNGLDVGHTPPRYRNTKKFLVENYGSASTSMPLALLLLRTPSNIQVLQA